MLVGAASISSGVTADLQHGIIPMSNIDRERTLSIQQANSPCTICSTLVTKVKEPARNDAVSPSCIHGH